MMKKTPSKNQDPKPKSPDTVKISALESIPYTYKAVRDIEICIQQPEFTSVCPMTGLPDFGTLSVRYCPKDKIIELKSLKFYLLQFRNVGIFYEHVVNHIMDDLVSVLDPKWLEITGDFTARGGITTKVISKYKSK